MRAEGARHALHQLVRDGAAKLCALALEAELQDFLEAHSAVLLADGSRALVRNGFLPERSLLTAVGEIPIRVPRTRDRGTSGATFTSALVPPYHSRFRVDARLPEAWLRACVDADVLPLLRILLGPQAALLAGSVLARIDSQWQERVTARRQRVLSDTDYLCWWADTAGGRELSPLLLFIVGMTSNGGHELVTAGMLPAAADRDAQQHEWVELLRGLRQRRLRGGPKLCEAEDLPGFWEALHQAFPGLPSGSAHGGLIGLR